MKVIIVLLIHLFVQMCTGNQTDMASKYKVQKISKQPEINAVWDKMPWSGIEPIQIKLFMGDKPEHFPFTQAKVAYDNTAIYVIFRVEDKYVKAVAGKNQGPVYLDSCVEFFFSPEDGIKEGYFNLEMNCGGTMLFHHQMEPRTKQTLLSEQHIQQVEVATTLPEIVDPEIVEEYQQAAFHVPDRAEGFALERRVDVVDELAQEDLAIAPLEGDFRIGAGDDGCGRGHVDLQKLDSGAFPTILHQNLAAAQWGASRH